MKNPPLNTQLLNLLQSQTKTSDSTISKSTPSIWLLGTLGCHLCDQAETLLKQLNLVEDFSYHYIDIIDLPTPWLEEFSNLIPVVISSKKTLSYPFSLMDLQTLL